MDSLRHCHNCSVLRYEVEKQQKHVVELRQENKLLKEKIKKLENQTLIKNQTTPMYKPRHTDYDDMSSPEMEELYGRIPGLGRGVLLGSVPKAMRSENLRFFKIGCI